MRLPSGDHTPEYSSLQPESTTVRVPGGCSPCPMAVAPAPAGAGRTVRANEQVLPRWPVAICLPSGDQSVSYTYVCVRTSGPPDGATRVSSGRKLSAENAMRVLSGDHARSSMTYGLVGGCESGGGAVAI